MATVTEGQPRNPQREWLLWLRQNRLDEAIGTAPEALSTPETVHSEHSVPALRDCRKRLAPNRHEPLVREFEHISRPVLGAAA